ncbi:MAG: FAD-dependent oxidoreductase [Bacteroidales bacterium]|nr:FAD-dependent oxidoreductase [Bacteroidales bacterium]
MTTETLHFKILKLANKISRTKIGAKNEVLPKHPEYKILEPIVTPEMADVGLLLEFRNPQTAEQISAKYGKSKEETSSILWELAMAGVAFVEKQDGIDKYWHDLWVPGHMEMIVNHKENVKKYPQLAEAFENYGRVKGPRAAGNIPIGMGPMRVIPIEQSINGETRRASYEEVSKYLNESEIFSVSDCSCRTSREVMGEGCGHLKEDMCIQLGHAAEYYIRTGRGREITREEAFDIIKKAEENGLMHQIPNTEGPGVTHAICNCCGCSCFALRLAEMYVNPDIIRSNYVSQVDPSKCVACGECVENCPTNSMKLGQKLCAETASVNKRKDLPHNTDWGPDKWNMDYRLNKELVLDSGTSPCKAECPAHIGIQGYIKLAAQGKYTEALQLIKTENPFPAVCGRICPRKCESACTRGDIDDPVAIDEIKKFIADQDLNADTRYVPRIKNEFNKKIAVIGSGPAGLSCAYYLAIEGYKVTVFEKRKVLGGMLTLGIPSFRLEKEVVQAEIDVLKELGVEFKCEVEVGKDISLDELRADGYEAFYLGIGAQGGRRLNIEGEDAKGVITGVDFLCDVNSGEDVKLNGKTIVIGGGNVAIDVARTAIRVSSDEVEMFCLESRDTMPALQEEVDEALEEGIDINNSWGPNRIITENGKVTGIEFRKCLSVFDSEGKFNPKFDNTDKIVIEAENILIAVGQTIEWNNLLNNSQVELNPNNTICADTKTYQTAQKDIFTGGDALTGPRFAIDAIAQGKEGAISIHRYVQPGQSLVLGRTFRDYQAINTKEFDLNGYDNQPREHASHVDGNISKESFKDLRTTFTEEQVQKETERCLGCGATMVDEFMCVGCGSCTTKCKFDAITLVRKYDSAGVEFEKLKPSIIKHALKRKVKIAVNKPIKQIQSLLDSK